MFEPTEPLLMFGTQMTEKLRQLTINEINQYSHKQLSDAFIDPKRKKNNGRRVHDASRSDDAYLQHLRGPIDKPINQ